MPEDECHYYHDIACFIAAPLPRILLRHMQIGYLSLYCYSFATILMHALISLIGNPFPRSPSIVLAIRAPACLLAFSTIMLYIHLIYDDVMIDCDVFVMDGLAMRLSCEIGGRLWDRWIPLQWWWYRAIEVSLSWSIALERATRMRGYTGGGVPGFGPWGTWIYDGYGNDGWK